MRSSIGFPSESVGIVWNVSCSLWQSEPPREVLEASMRRICATRLLAVQGPACSIHQFSKALLAECGIKGLEQFPAGGKRLLTWVAVASDHRKKAWRASVCDKPLHDRKNISEFLLHHFE